MAGWDDDDFEVPDLVGAAEDEAAPARAALASAGLLPPALAPAPSDDADWFGARAPTTLPGDTAALGTESSSQAINSLNTPAERKKPRCMECTRPLGDSPNAKLCSRCAGKAGATAAPTPAPADDRPLILVDLTVLSDGRVHNRFDKHSVNDPDAKRELANKIGAEYSKYSADAELIARGVVRPCAQSTWREALVTLRDEVPGHYWAPIFPPR